MIVDIVVGKGLVSITLDEVGVSCSTWSETCGSCNFPRFLLSKGSLTLM